MLTSLGLAKFSRVIVILTLIGITCTTSSAAGSLQCGSGHPKASHAAAGATEYDAPNGTVVVIIGASQGIGFNTAKYMALYGCAQLAFGGTPLIIVITCRSQPDCIDASSSIEHAVAETCGTNKRGVKISTLAPFDATNQSDILGLAHFLASSYGGVDAVVYNAGASSELGVAYLVRLHCVGFSLVVGALRPILRRPGRFLAVTSILGTISNLPDIPPSDYGKQLDAVYKMVTEQPDPDSVRQSLIRLLGGSLSNYPRPYAYSKTLQNMAVQSIAAETAADLELEVNAVCPGWCPTAMNPPGEDTPRQCVETIMWLALGRRDSSHGGRVHGGFFRHMRRISFEDGTDLMEAGVPDDGMRSWWDKIASPLSWTNRKRP
jgi:NAD(P)-dependent dehydrogenase (short-subunit alcohol dehydrogenase family)